MENGCLRKVSFFVSNHQVGKFLKIRKHGVETNGLTKKQALEYSEKENLKEKPWNLKGEVTSFTRPKDSLVDMDLSFQHTSKSVPIITEEVTQNLEEIIIQRIVGGIYDDPKRPEKESEKKKEKELDHEKNKLSLAQVYEKDLLKKNNIDIQDKEEDQKTIETKIRIKNMVSKTLHTLNFLSNLNYVPPPVELKMKEKETEKSEKQTPQEIMKPIKYIKDKTKEAKPRPKKVNKEIKKKEVDYSKSKEFFKEISK